MRQSKREQTAIWPYVACHLKIADREGNRERESRWRRKSREREQVEKEIERERADREGNRERADREGE